MLLIGQVQTLLDDDPKTNPAYTEIMAGIGLIAMGWNARDEVVTSEQAGVK